ncbi:Methyltransferase domain-containing protein [Williamsia serinedens]|uniref:Methyltransferase domain-containing protein n=2 Tax=Williamsia serinedens TaxID=391736 RepID=A0ABT1H5Y9_9NOCA|nr:Methyltransferase domain-containing protein [Williamsia serinedens]
MTDPAVRQAVRDLLTVPVRDESAGYLDLLEPERSGRSPSQRLMENSVFAAVYERAWRPVFTRLFSLGGTSTLVAGRALTGRLGRPGDRRVLDVACGPGNFTDRFARDLTGDGFCVGLDFSTPMLARAVADNDAPRAVYVRGDAHHIPFPDGSFDSVCCLAALYLIGDPLRVVDEMVRVVAPGGEVAVFTSVQTTLSSVPGARQALGMGGFRIFGRDEITDRLTAAGMRDVRQQITGQGQYVLATAPHDD